MALVVAHDSVAVPPLAMLPGVTESVAVGSGTVAVTVSVTVRVTVPVALLAVRVYVVVPDGLTGRLPVAATAPIP